MPAARQRFAHPPAALRAAALVLDAMLGLLVSLAIRMAWLGWQAERGVLDLPEGTAGLLHGSLLAGMLVFVLLREVPFGASPAQWLLCLRRVPRRRAQATLLWRLLHAPQHLLETLRGLADTPSGSRTAAVMAYVPSRRGLLVRTALTAAAATFSLSWAVESVRPSIGRRDATRLAEFLVQHDPLLDRTLGPPLTFEVGDVTRRAHQREPGTRGTFTLQIRGRRARQEMTVHARKVERRWVVEELRDIAFIPSGVDSPDVAHR